MIEKIKFIQSLKDADLPKDQFAIINSSWLALFDIRQNGDLDLIIKEELWDTRFPDRSKNLSFGLPGQNENRIRIHGNTSWYYTLGKGSVENLIDNETVEVEGIRFIKPKVYIRYKKDRTEEFQKKLKELSFFRREILKDRFFCPYGIKKCFRKVEKDTRDFELIRSFFHANEGKNPLLDSIPKSDWGLEFL